MAAFIGTDGSGGEAFTRSCENCQNRAMDMDLDPYCGAVNAPWGLTLTRGRPEECGKEFKLWKIDLRRGPRSE